MAVEDLIGRRPVDIKVDEIAGYIKGKRVLVTGAGGSIGSELCRQIVQFAPAELIMLDHDETGLQQTQISITGRGLLAGRDTVLANIRDGEALQDIFEDRRPEVVFHAAALKHAPLLQQYPVEAVEDQRLRHPERAARRPARRRLALREHLHRQGGEPHHRPGPLQAGRREADRAGWPARPAARSCPSASAT